MREMGMGVSTVGGTKRQLRDWRRSAEPEEEVEARLPCCGRMWSEFVISSRARELRRSRIPLYFNINEYLE